MKHYNVDTSIFTNLMGKKISSPAKLSFGGLDIFIASNLQKLIYQHYNFNLEMKFTLNVYT